MSERQEEGAEQARAGTGDEERDESLGTAVEAARREGEESATAEIVALEQDLERERERAADALEQVQRRLEEAEARAEETEQERTREEARRSERERRSSCLRSTTSAAFPRTRASG